MDDSNGAKPRWNDCLPSSHSRDWKDNKPKQRPIVLDTSVLAYLGDYITMVEKGVKNIAQEEVDKEKKAKR